MTPELGFLFGREARASLQVLVHLPTMADPEDPDLASPNRVDYPIVTHPARAESAQCVTQGFAKALGSDSHPLLQ